VAADEGHGEEEFQQLLSVAQLFSQQLSLNPTWAAICLSIYQGGQQRGWHGRES